MSEVKSGVVKLSALVKRKVGKRLKIPDYQRPYVWGREQVRILLEDIQESLSQDGGYLLGSLILYRSQNDKNQKCFDIVDGQQRLTTLALILRALDINKKQDGEGTQESVSDNFLSDAEFEHTHSKYHIKDNWEFIKEWIKGKVIDKDDLLNKIEFIYVLAPSLDDAFIFFDSANAKGKALEDYDLMKAFHLRALEKDPQLNDYATWFEELAKKKDGDSLKVFFEEIIAPLRAWIRQEEIDADKIKLYDEFCKESKEYEIVSHRDLGVARGIVSGKDFFIYLREYMEIFEIVKSDKLYQSLFHNTGLYIRYLYAMVLILYFDKFDKFEKKNDEMMPLIARIILALRLKQRRIQRATIRNEAIKLLPKIFFTQTHSELKRFLEKKKANEGEIKVEWKGFENWCKKFQEILSDFDEFYQWKPISEIKNQKEGK